MTVVRKSLIALLAWAAAGPLGEAASRNKPRTIGSIEIRTYNVFDEEEQSAISWGYGFANRLHITTREEVVRQELLFDSGDPYDQEVVAETERNLRALPFLRDAEVKILESDNGIADVRVST